MILEFTQSAVSDLEKISQYTRDTWGEEQEERYLKSLYRKFAQIAGDPSRWRFREELFPRCQIAREGRHLILFQVNASTLIIVRILHGAMDFGRHIPDDFE